LLDTDIGTDVDDAYALAFALRHPELNLVGVTTVGGDTLRRGQIAAKLLQHAGRPDVPVAAGLPGEPPPGRSGWMGHEGEGLLEPEDRVRVVPRDGVSMLLDVSGARDGEFAVAAIGGLTNVASALQRDPSLARRMHRIAVMGGAFAPIRVGDRHLPASIDHNLNVDPQSALYVLNADLPLSYVPTNVTIRTVRNRAQLDRLRHGDDLCRALARLTDRWTPLLHRTIPGLPDDWVALLHDPLTVACLLELPLTAVESRPVRASLHHGEVHILTDPARGRHATIITDVDAEALARTWLDVVTTPT